MSEPLILLQRLFRSARSLDSVNRRGDEDRVPRATFVRPRASRAPAGCSNPASRSVLSKRLSSRADQTARMPPGLSEARNADESVARSYSPAFEAVVMAAGPLSTSSRMASNAAVLDRDRDGHIRSSMRTRGSFKGIVRRRAERPRDSTPRPPGPARRRRQVRSAGRTSRAARSVKPIPSPPMRTRGRARARARRHPSTRQGILRAVRPARHQALMARP